jgi:oligoribonuclease (3'-5' exoribonuclease)
VKCVYNIQRFVDTAVTIQNEDTYWELDGVGLIKRNKRKLDVWYAPSDVSAETKPKDPKYREHMCVDVVGLTGGATLAYNVKLPDVMSVYQKTYNKFVGIDLETGGLNNINLVGDTYIHGAARNLIFQAAVMVCDGKFVTEHLSEITVFHPQMEVQMEQEAVDLHKKTGLWDSLLVEYENASNYKELLVRIADSKCRSINIFVPFDESIDGELSDMFRVQSADIIERYILSTIPDLTYDRSLGLGCTMFGSSVHFDQDFVRHQMPTLNSRFQHRMVDVSALAIACNALSSVKPYFKKYNHRAMDDIVETYKELKYLMRFVG